MLAALTACIDSGRPVRRVAVQLDDGVLRYQLGGECEQIRILTVELNVEEGQGLDAMEAWRLTAVADSGASVSEIELGSVPQGFRETDPFSGSLREADSVTISLVDRSGSQALDTVETETLIDGAESHPDGWFVSDEGWLTAAEFDDLIDPGDGVYPLCPP